MISLSVISHGQRDLTIKLLEDLARHRCPDVSEVIYTRNLPEPPLPPIDLGHVRLVAIDNRIPKGYGENHNAAFAQCRQPYFCVCNPDISLPGDPFGRLLGYMNERGLGLTGPLVKAPDGTIENSARRLYTPWELIRQKLAPANQGSGEHWIAGMFMLFRAEAFRSIGGFDPRYHLYIEDVDICTRLCVKGWALGQCPDAEVVHDARRDSHRTLRYSLWHLSGMLRYWSSPGFWQYRRLLAERAAGGEARFR